MEAQTMDRGTEAMKAHLSGCSEMEIRQTRRGWFQECLGCEANTEFKYFMGDQQFAHSLEDADCFCRICCPAIHPFVMVVKELNTDAELVTVDRPLRCPMTSCKCCCYQEVTMSSGGQVLGTLTEDCFYCVFQATYRDNEGKEVYKIHPPTCLGGMCMNCFTEGSGCNICCRCPFHIFPADLENTNGADPIGKIVKKPKSLMTELLTDANAFEMKFPENATAAEKASLMGTAVFINSVFFEGENE